MLSIKTRHLHKSIMLVLRLLCVKLVLSIKTHHLYNARCHQFTNKNERQSQHKKKKSNMNDQNENFEM